MRKSYPPFFTPVRSGKIYENPVVCMNLIDWGCIAGYIPKLIPPMFKVTFVCVFLTFILGSVFGFIFCLCKLSKNKILRKVIYTITDIIRSVPFLVMLFLLYYGLPQFFPALNDLNKLFFLVLGLVIFASCRMSEIMRSAYEAVDRRQLEAALSVGLSVPQALIHVVVPQAFYIALPNLGNLIVGQVLESALGFTIGVYDIMGTAKLINAREYGAHNIEIYIAAALIYWVISLLISFATGALEKALRKDQSSTAGQEVTA